MTSSTTNPLVPPPHSPEWYKAMACRYNASFHIAPLPSGKLAVFFDGWQLVAVATPEELVEYFRNPPALRQRPAPAESASDFLSSLGL